MIMYERAAAVMGWKWSAAHDGYISESHKGRNGAPLWSDYHVAPDAEQACFLDGIESQEQAAQFLKTRQAA